MQMKEGITQTDIMIYDLLLNVTSFPGKESYLKIRMMLDLWVKNAKSKDNNTRRKQVKTGHLEARMEKRVRGRC